MSLVASLSSTLVPLFGHAFEDVAHLEEKLEVRLRLLVKGAGIDTRVQDAMEPIISPVVLIRSSHIHDEPLPSLEHVSCLEKLLAVYGPRIQSEASHNVCVDDSHDQADTLLFN